jgi:hypothetical protein
MVELSRHWQTVLFVSCLDEEQIGQMVFSPTFFQTIQHNYEQIVVGRELDFGIGE